MGKQMKYFASWTSFKVFGKFFQNPKNFQCKQTIKILNRRFTLYFFSDHIENDMMAWLITNKLSLSEQILQSIWLKGSHKSCFGIQIRPPTVAK